MSFKIYSIESRKGGVGKTTIALNLAKQLLSKGPVLLLDCDITGTSISDPASNSIYWKDDANVLKGENGVPYNLLGYFLEKYVRGNGNMNDFMKEGMLQEKKINVIGSQLYAPSSKAIVDTRLLMDEIHSYWLMEFVNSLIAAFEMKYPDKKVHIIIDNSPGYVGFCQALHNYMFNLGPEQAKYLMVSSMDEQDLKSCVYACTEIKDIVEARIAAAHYCQSQIEGNQPNLDEEKKINRNVSLKKFYFSLMDKPRLLEKYCNSQIKEKNYMALVLNKVPKNLKDDNFDYTFENVLKKEDMPLFNALTSAKDATPQTIIYYDEAISYQYYIKYLRSQIEDVSRDKYWSNRFKDLESLNAEYAHLTDRISAIGKVSTIYNNLISNLSSRGYSRVAKSMPPSWDPSYPLGRLHALLARIASRSFPSRRVEFTAEEKETIHRFNIRDLQSAGSRLHFLLESQELDALYKFVDESTRGDNDTDKRLYSIVSLFLHVSLRLLLINCNGKDNLKDALMDDMLRPPFEYSWREYVDQNLMHNLQIDAMDLSLDMFFRRFFYDFHSYFCLTLVRMIDLHTDFSIIIKVLRQYIPTTSPMMFSRELIDYISNVIVYKAENFDEEKLASIKDNSFVMKRVQEVIKDCVLKNWR